MLSFQIKYVQDVMFSLVYLAQHSYKGEITRCSKVLLTDKHPFHGKSPRKHRKGQTQMFFFFK